MQARYRSDYPGEFVVVESRWANGKKEEKREWIENPIQNQHISGRAACIASNINRDKFDYTRLQRHRGGLLGSKKLQTYGVGSIALEMRLDFTVDTDKTILATLKESKYSENNIVYTTPRNCIDNPGEFYLIPQNPRLFNAVQCVYLAAFDGHREVFLLGYNNETPVGNPTWPDQLRTVLDSYPGIMFHFVGEKTNMYDTWLDADNTKVLTYRDFIGYCDV
jgi:hypothetical protein